MRRWPAFWHESQMPDWMGLILVKFPTVRSKPLVKSPGYAQCDGRLWKWLYITKNDFQYSRLLLIGNAQASYLPSKIFKSPCIYLNCTASPSHRTTNIFVIKLHQFVTSLRYTFREALRINTLLSREIPILLFPLYRKRYPLRGGTFSIVHYGEYPSGQWDLVMNFQFLVKSCKNCTYDQPQTWLLGILQN